LAGDKGTLQVLSLAIG